MPRPIKILRVESFNVISMEREGWRTSAKSKSFKRGVRNAERGMGEGNGNGIAAGHREGSRRPSRENLFPFLLKKIFSVVPAGLGTGCVLPGVKTPGYCRASLRDDGMWEGRRQGQSKCERYLNAEWGRHGEMVLRRYPAPLRGAIIYGIHTGDVIPG